MDRRVSVSQITILLLYILTAAGFAGSRLRHDAGYAGLMRSGAFVLGAIAIADPWLRSCSTRSPDGGGIHVSVLSSVSLDCNWPSSGCLRQSTPTLRGMAAGLMVLAAVAAAIATQTGAVKSPHGLTWQLQTHIFIAMFAYGLLTAGAIVAIYALVQDRRLRAAKLST